MSPESVFNTERTRLHDQSSAWIGGEVSLESVFDTED